MGEGRHKRSWARASRATGLATTGLLMTTLLPAGVTGCGTAKSPRGTGQLGLARSTRLVDAARPPYINGLAVNPADGSLLFATNRNLYRVSRDGRRLTTIHSQVIVKALTGPYGHKVSSFVFAGPNRLVGSGHPDGVGSRLPPFLGVIRSSDAGRHWKAVSRVGLSDLHVMNMTHRTIYAFDPVLNGVIVSTDRGATFAERSSPGGPVLDLAVDQRDANYLLASTPQGISRSTDQGRSWRALQSAASSRLAWTPKGLTRADADGSVKSSADRGVTWKETGRLAGTPAKLLGLADGTLYAALNDGTITVSRDGGRSWKTLLRP